MSRLASRPVWHLVGIGARRAVSITSAPLLAILASVGWGFADFLAGLSARRMSVVRVLAWSQPIGLIPILIALAISGDELVVGRSALIAAAAGIASVASLGLFYLALAKGKMALVGPIEATGVCLPVLVGWFSGEVLAQFTMIGVALAIVGTAVVVSSATEPNERGRHSRSAALALCSGALYGGFLSLLDLASTPSPIVATTYMRIASCTVAIGLYLACRAGARSPGGRPGPVLEARRPRTDVRAHAALPLIGVADAGAELCFATASVTGTLSTAAVLSSLYPITTAMIAALVLRERVRPIQGIGATCALAGALLLSAEY